MNVNIIEFKIRNKHDLPKFEKTMCDAYACNKKVCFVFHTSQVKFYDIELLSNMIPILEKYRKQTREKLMYTTIYVDATWKLVVLKAFIKMLRPEKKIFFKLIK